MLTGTSSMAEISRDVADLVGQTIGPHHQYPDGLMLFCGTMFAPIQDRERPGQGFTHQARRRGDHRLPGARHAGQPHRALRPHRAMDLRRGALMRNLSARGLL